MVFAKYQFKSLLSWQKLKVQTRNDPTSAKKQTQNSLVRPSFLGDLLDPIETRASQHSLTVNFPHITAFHF